MGFDIKGAINRGIAQSTSSADKDFIDNLSGIMKDGKPSLSNLRGMIDYLSNPGNNPQEFEGDWLIDYLQGKTDGFSLGPLTDILGLDTKKLSQFDQAFSFAQMGVEKLSHLGYGVGDFVTKVQSGFSDGFKTLTGGLVTTLRENPFVKSLFSYVGVIDEPGDPLRADMNVLLNELLETNGYVVNRKRSKQIAKGFHFITRPYLESDNMGLYRTYVFFTRPNTNLVVRGSDGKFYPHPQLYKYKELSALVESNVDLYAELCRDNCGKSNLFTLINNYCKEIPPVKLNETDREGIKNKFGFSMPVIGVSNNNGLDLSVTFMDNADGDISALFRCLDLYKREVANGGYAKRPEYIKYNMIDTAMSAYIVVTDTNFNIINFGVAIGLHMSDPPTQGTRHSIDGFTKEDILGEFTINFKCFDFSPNDPSYYDSFNRISGFDPSRIVDTSGSAKTLYKLPVSIQDRITLTTDKSCVDERMSHRRSVFDDDWYGYNGENDIKTGIVEQAKSSFLNGNKSIGEMVINKASEFATKVGFFSESSKSEDTSRQRKSVNMGYYMPYPDVFEYIAQFPGVYAQLASVGEQTDYLNTSDDTASSRKRVKYKLGFSR